MHSKIVEKTPIIFKSVHWGVGGGGQNFADMSVKKLLVVSVRLRLTIYYIKGNIHTCALCTE